MNYDNALLSEIEKIYFEKRKKAEEPVENVQNALFLNDEYLKAYNGFNTTRLEISKAKFKGQNDKLPSLQEKLNDFSLKMQEIKDAFGYESKSLVPTYECKHCSDTGRTKDGRRCKCFKKLVYKLTLEKLGLEKKKLPTFKKAGYKDLNNLQKIYEKMEQYCQKFPDTDKNIVIAGSVGTGKSYLAGCIASELISKDFNVIFVSACELNSIFLKYHVSPIDEKGSYLDLLTNCDLLVIDDLGSEPIYKNVTEECLLMIITERMTKSNPFIITTNLEQDQLLDRYGDRTLSRLNDKKKGVFIQIKGEDLRRKKK